MSFIALPLEFDQGGVCHAFEIARQQEGATETAGILRGDRDLPVNLQFLAENLASALNGNAPLHPEIGRSHTMLHEQNTGGVAFRFREPGKAGVSTPMAIFTRAEGVDVPLERIFNEDSLKGGVGRAFMQAAQSPASTSAVAAKPVPSPATPRPAF